MRATFYSGKLLIAGLLFSVVPDMGLMAQICSDSVIIDENYKERCENQNFKIKGAEIKKDLLFIEVEVCKRNRKKCFFILSHGFYAESYPPQLEVNLVQKQSKQCKRRKYTSQQLVFNISKLKYKGTELVLKLKDYPGRLVYLYN